jgi:hypothetical protein
VEKEYVEYTYREDLIMSFIREFRLLNTSPDYHNDQNERMRRIERILYALRSEGYLDTAIKIYKTLYGDKRRTHFRGN